MFPQATIWLYISFTICVLPWSCKFKLLKWVTITTITAKIANQWEFQKRELSLGLLSRHATTSLCKASSLFQRWSSAKPASSAPISRKNCLNWRWNRIRFTAFTIGRTCGGGDLRRSRPPNHMSAHNNRGGDGHLQVRALWVTVALPVQLLRHPLGQCLFHFVCWNQETVSTQ